MLKISNICGLNAVNRINFCSDVDGDCHKVVIPNSSNDIIVSADECLEAYKRGGMLVHIRDKKAQEISRKKADEFISNMLLESDLDTNGNKLNLYDSLADFMNQEIVSEFKEIRLDEYGKSKEIQRYEFLDGSAIDKDLYNSLKHFAVVNPYSKGYYIRKYFSAIPSKINVGDYIFLIGRKSKTVVTNIIDSEGNITGKRYRQDGSVSSVLKSGNEMGKRYSADGTVVDKKLPAESTFFN